ncbi:helix-turn-helix transcriptional regulator [Micrococcales bacterium 31B]|nr:helix-turn-helix transcriptional regulator [Micrococcales bacterium 31B]
MEEQDRDQLKAFGEFVRAQRQLAHISQRNLARSAGFSDSYLSQLERGTYMPSAKTVHSLAEAFGMPASLLFAQLGLHDDEDRTATPVEDAILADPHLSPAQREALITVYRSYVATARAESAAGA